jgi:hypothetical protein
LDKNVLKKKVKFASDDKEEEDEEIDGYEADTMINAINLGSTKTKSNPFEQMIKDHIKSQKEENPSEDQDDNTNPSESQGEGSKIQE